jgi:hypothetical protein
MNVKLVFTATSEIPLFGSRAAASYRRTDADAIFQLEIRWGAAIASAARPFAKL